MTKRVLAWSWCALAVLGSACTSDYSDDDYCDYCGGGAEEPTPRANDDHLMLDEDQTAPVSAYLVNDENVKWVKIVDAPKHGTINTYRAYVPNPGFSGVDQFSYDGTYSSYSTESSHATVYVLVKPDGIPYETSQWLADTNTTSMDSGDIDGDGKIDIVTCSSARHEMTIFRNTTTAVGAYSVEEHAFEGGTSPLRVVVADLDRDGKPDILTAAANGVTIFHNITTGPLAFEAPVKLTTPNQVTSLVTTDLDGDGVVDIAAVEGDSFFASGELHAWLNKSTPGSFSFGTEATFATPRSPGDLLVVDADGNGAPDLALLARGQDSESLSLFLNATSAGGSVAAFQTRIDRDTGPNPQHMFLADLDGDGHDEIGVLHAYGVLWIYANRGAASPTYEAARVLDVGDVRLLQPVQLDGDSRTDLFGLATGEAPLQLMTSTSQPQTFDFDTKPGYPGDVENGRLVVFSSPSAFIYADLDGVPPSEIVVGSSAYPDGPLRVLFGP